MTKVGDNPNINSLIGACTLEGELQTYNNRSTSPNLSYFCLQNAMCYMYINFFLNFLFQIAI